MPTNESRGWVSRPSTRGETRVITAITCITNFEIVSRKIKENLSPTRIMDDTFIAEPNAVADNSGRDYSLWDSLRCETLSTFVRYV